ncbi:hypothetical protein KY284_020730 [Solanum tuberosum]|nr:hypothetical protein KY284_020730 [Solanum tuberosum]
MLGQNWVSTTRIFNESVITSHFDVLAKITVFQEYHVRNLYLGLFHYTSSSNEGLEENNDEALKLFENECLSPEFKKIGKEIARICQGLPLATVVMVGVLLKIGNSLDGWKKVVEDVNVLMSKDLDHHCSKVLTLSYYHLPCHIIACLLYLVRCLQEE